MENRKQYPKVGIGVIVVKDDKILIGKRRNAHGEGTWAFPGGHLHFDETWEECAKREVMEETGLKIKNTVFVQTTNDIMQKDRKHYITIYMKADFVSGEAKVCEPDKCEGWEWREWDDLPSPRFIPLENLLKFGFHL